MAYAEAIDLVREALRTALVLSTPALLVLLIVGLLVGLAQAATQLQEPTISLVPRLIAGAITLLVLIPWLVRGCTTYAAAIFRSIPDAL